MFAGYQKGDELMDMMIENSNRKGGYQGSPLGENGGNWNRSSGTGGIGGGALPHPMMMMPGQQNLMTNYFTPGLMMKTPSNYLNTDYASLPPGINLSHNLLLEEEDGGGSRGQQSLSEKLR